MRIDGTLAGILVALSLAASAQAQGLGDAAKREAERRKAAQQKPAPVKSYTDQDLPSSQAPPPAAEEASEDTAEASGEALAVGSPGSVIGGLPTARSGKSVKAASSAPSGSSSSTRESSSESYGSNPGSEASWRAAAGAARRKVEDAEKRVQELDKKAASLMYAPTGDCNVGGATNMSYEDLKKYKCVDPVAQWQGERQRTLDALEQAKADLEKARKDQETMQESARRQGALPGWLRE